MSKIKEVSSFNGSTWGTAVPLGVNDSNVDITSSTTNAADSTATLAGLDNTAVTVTSGDTDASAWTKFNKFRKRVKNVFGNYVTTSLVVNAYKPSPSSGDIYSAGVLNNYMANVIGISGTSTTTVAGSKQTVLSAINSLNDNKVAKSAAIKSLTCTNDILTMTMANNTTKQILLDNIKPEAQEDVPITNTNLSTPIASRVRLYWHVPESDNQEQQYYTSIYFVSGMVTVGSNSTHYYGTLPGPVYNTGGLIIGIASFELAGDTTVHAGYTHVWGVPDNKVSFDGYAISILTSGTVAVRLLIFS